MRRAVWAYVCVACGHYVRQHRMTKRAITADRDRFRCPCGCEIDQDSPMSELWDRPADETPFLAGGGQT